MILNLDYILKDCPPKLLPLYPMMAQKIAEWQDSVDKKNFNPLILIVDGSRGSGKSQFFQRASNALIYDGYAKTVKMTTMTKDGLKGCIAAVESIEPDCVGTGVNISSMGAAYREIADGRIYFDFFGKTDIKNEQQKKDLLICEEVEKWDAIQGIAALETEIRHCGVIVIISNNLPTAVADFGKAHDAIFITIDWYENPALPEHIRKSYEKARIENPTYYWRFIMCRDNGDGDPWFDETSIENFFSRPVDSLTQDERNCYAKVLSIDVGGGFGDASVITKVSRTRFGTILVECLGEHQVETPALASTVANYRASSRAIEEVWDVDGIGLSAMQARAPDPAQRKALGVIKFHGNDVPVKSPTLYYNRRSEAYALWRDLLNQNQCWYVGNPMYVDKIKREMHAQIWANAEACKGKVRLEKKDKIKKNLNGESPNIADAIAMGVWRASTMPAVGNEIKDHKDFINSLNRTHNTKRWF